MPIAIGAVRAWLNAHAGDDMTVVFNVFSAEDEAIYRRLLGMENEIETTMDVCASSGSKEAPGISLQGDIAQLWPRVAS